ncbi:MAG TPA: amino acid ABC transporter ATP-binding protein [Ligilactobacillus saerimneri]|nr:amino acid ABC transporter ATP-binding protein [Ligilactobacillus saerimneri]
MLELRNINKSFGNRQIITDLNLQVEDGSILCIVGESGGGKTTLLRCISGLETIDSGQLLVDGRPFDPQATTSEAVIGVVFQDYNLFLHLTVLENITLAPHLVLKQDMPTAQKAARTLLTQLSLADKADLYPYQLSGGQKQRVAIARALAMKPQFLCYDEPTSALDPTLSQAVKEIILSLKAQGMTQIVVTHDWDFAAAIADQTLTVTPVQA